MLATPIASCTSPCEVTLWSMPVPVGSQDGTVHTAPEGGAVGSQDGTVQLFTLLQREGGGGGITGQYRSPTPPRPGPW